MKLKRGIPSGDVSQSKARLYEQCPRAYRERYVVPYARRLPAPPNEDMIVGSLVHAALEQIVRLARAGSPHPIDQVLARVARAQDSTPGFAARLRAAALVREVAGDLRPEDVLEEHGELHVEIAFDLRVGDGFTAVGVFDRVDGYANGTIAVVDYKSGGEILSREELAQDFQAGLYLAAARECWPEASLAFTRWNLAAGIKVTIPWSTEIDAAARAHALDVALRIKRESEWKAKPGAHCGRCPYSASCHDYQRLVEASVDVAIEIGAAGTPSLLADEALASERLRLRQAEHVLEARRREVDEEIRARFRAGQFVAAGHVFREVPVRAFADVPLADAAALIQALGGRDSAETVALAIGRNVVIDEKLEAYLGLLPPEKATEILKALKKGRRPYDASSKFDVRPINGPF